MTSFRAFKLTIVFISLLLVTSAWAGTEEAPTNGGKAMAYQRINLQNTPSISGVTSRDLSFDSNGVTLKGTLYTPTGASLPLPGVVVAGAWTTVKEQMAGTYARELAARGFAALAFDFTGWGASDGDIRYKEEPAVKTADIIAAAVFMHTLGDVDAKRIYGLGICASAGYMAAAVADSPFLNKLALIAPWLHDVPMAETIYGGPESAAKLVATGRAAEKAPSPQIMVAASTTDKNSLMYQAPYYTEKNRGLIPEYDNQFNVASWEPWLTYDAQASADRLTAPTLIVCSEAAALPAGAHAYVKRTKASVKEIWLDNVNQFDFYDRADIVERSADAVAAHFEPGNTVSDEQAIANTMARYLKAVDQGDWDRVKTFMTNPFYIDFASFGGGDPETLDPSELLSRWAGFLPGFDHTHHQTGNLDINIFGLSAKLGCYITASHVIGERVWTVVGEYNNTLAKGDDGKWRISGSRLVFKYQSGDTGLPAEAQKRVVE